ncbi:MAG: hypothetical protein ACYSUM_23050, partial [Planctomycetota bacterium]
MLESLTRWLANLGLPEAPASHTARGIAVVAVVLLAWLANLAARTILTRTLSRLAHRTRTDLDDVMVRRRVFSRLAHLAPALVIWGLAPLALDGLPGWIDVARRGAEIYMVLVALLVIDALLNSANDIYAKFEVSRRVPILGYLQVVKILASILGAVAALSIALQ